jgi:hypothetical protein
VFDDREHLLGLYRARVAGYDVDDEFRGRWLAWCRQVLICGGELVVPPVVPEPDLDQLLLSGVRQDPAVRESTTLQGDCHANVARLWIDGEIVAIGTGYALNEDLWRQHSWGLLADGAILETTASRESYYGVTLAAGEPTVLFALNGYDGDVKERLRAGGERADEIIQVLRKARQRRSSAGEERDPPYG